jgi:hypothetical protein
MCIILIYFYNITIYFCNTDMKHLQRTSEHLKHLKHIFAICVFRPSSSMQRKEEWGTVGSGQPAAEDGDAAWAWRTMAFSLRRLAWARRAMGLGMARRGMEAP